ncbi:zinc finger protein 888 isoform X2 [Entelurus aequoreus]|uniref:zinc finger protein 888 isoform X2 n=1 Tax=Entelurus aequoreus TaxID=161455 RepID=UPI002B1CF0AB|nr:zinc finger protein 888 isoform X2 [Entelurus aequoreus]
MLLVSGPHLCMQTHHPCNGSNHRCVIREFDDGVLRVGWTTVMGVEGIQQRAQHTALWRADAECAEGEEMGAEFHRLGSVGQEVPNPKTGLEDSDMAALLSVEMDAGRTGQALHHQNLGTDRKCDSAKVSVHRAEQGLEEYFTEGNMSPVTHDRGQLCCSSPKGRLLKLDSLGVSVKQETIVDCGGIPCVKKEDSQPEMLSSCAVKRNRESYLAPKQSTNPRKMTAQEQLKQNSNVGTFDRSRATMKQLIRPIKKPALSNNTLALSCTYLNVDPLNRIPSTSKATLPATLQRSHPANKFTSAVSRTGTQCVSNRSQPHARSLAHPDGHAVHPLRCGHCDKCFPHLSNLKAHLQIHTGERPFCCSLCGRSFTKLSNLKAHRRVHTGERPYCCLACGKRFTQKCNLKRHQRIHMDE